MSKSRLSCAKYTTDNRSALEQSDRCGCVACMKMFNPGEITEWFNDTAICPHCEHTDGTVIPGVSFNYSLNDLRNLNSEGGFYL